MSKRNFILLIITLFLSVALIFGFLYFRKTKEGEINGKKTEGINFISQFNPFNSKSEQSETLPVETPEYQPNPDENPIKMKLEKISSMPVAGFTSFIKERLKETPAVAAETPLAETEPLKTNKKTIPSTELALALRYVDKKTGNIYQTFVNKITEQKFSSTIIPKVYDAYFGNHGQSVIMRYLKNDERTIETFVGNLPKESVSENTMGNNEIKGSFLPDNVQDISMSPDGLKIFYLFTSGSLGENIVGTTLNFLNNKKVQVFSSPFTEWLSLWPQNNTITLSTKPSANIPGFMYTIDSSGKNLTKVLGNISGLTTLMSPNGKLVLWSDNNLFFNVYDMDKRNSKTLGIKTLPEKCVWGRGSDVFYCAVPRALPADKYPDNWYQGKISFGDQFWQIDAKSENGTILVDGRDNKEGEEIDGIKLALDEKENYLFFVNKKDSFLWKLELK